MEVNPNFSPRAKEDYQLVQAALRDDQQSYAELMSRYKDSIFFMILKMVHNRDDADDLTIEAFGKAFANLEKYSPDFAFSTWLFKIAMNNCIDFIRKKKLETMSIDEPVSTDKGDEFSFDLKAPSLDPEETYIKEQRKLLMHTVLDKINPKYKHLIQLRYFEELSYEEIADKLELPLGTVKAQLFRAKELLFNILRKSKGRY
ncbi:MAG: sigma-70 family RNA polymerase sigma factor [Bacteroidetes bacterium]|nr:sigma-70 family RNA polymerase sigma factor [Bacteroidota bacterium]